MEAEKIAREREPGEGSAQTHGLARMDAALTNGNLRLKIISAARIMSLFLFSGAAAQGQIFLQDLLLG